MLYQEKKAFVTLISNTLIIILYAFIVFQRHQDKIFSDPNDLGFWAAVVLILVPVSAFAHIIVHIIFVIFNKILTNEDDPGIMDELDKLIELKAMRNIGWTFIVGFYLSLVTQLLDWKPYTMIITMLIAGYVASVIGEITKIYFYKKGVKNG